MPTSDLYSEHADTIEAVLAYVRRSHRLTADAGDEFSSWARVRLLENDRAVLRKFKGLSNPRTFLTVVIQNLFRDWQTHELGRWRPTSRGRRLGPVAVELERIVLRDKIDFDQAVEMLASRGTATRPECETVWAQLRRQPAGRKAVGIEVLENVPSPAAPDPIEITEQQDFVRRLDDALAAVLPALPVQDQLIIKLHFADGFTLARIAELLGLEQKPFYRRLEKLATRLREALIAHGVSEDEVQDYLTSPIAQLRPVFVGFGAGKPRIGPSTPSNAGGGA